MSSYDVNGKLILKKGTMVKVLTTNGGEMVASLSHNYYPTFDVSLEWNGHTTVISSYRTSSVEELV